MQQSLTQTIENTKKKLISDLKRKGMIENFGQKELRNIEDKFNFILLCYGTPQERLQAEEIENFRRWCETYSI